MEAKPFASYGDGPGVRIDVFNETRPYGYSNLFHVKLRVVARFDARQETYERSLERLGVSDCDVARVRSKMLGSFEACSLPYLLRADFPEKLAKHKQRKRLNAIRFRGSP